MLSVMLAVASFSATAISASAQIDTKGEYTPSQVTETRRYYFIMPEDWKNEYAETCGIYWWAGTDPADPWPGYTANKTEFDNIYYCDVPADVSTIIWNNAFNGGDDTAASEFYFARQTANISAEYYEEGECDFYPNGIDAENGFDNMIYVLDPNSVLNSEFSGKVVPSGEWYYYYGDGTYSWYPTKAEAVKAGKVFDSDYLIIEDVFEKSAEPTEPSTEVTEPSTEATEPSTEATEPSTEATEPTTEPTTEPSTEPTEDTTGVDVDGDSDSDAPTKPSTDTDADDKDNNSNNSNGSVQTGGASTAFGMFALFVVAVGVMYTLRKKEIFN